LLDVAGGTDIVSNRMAARGHQVAVSDLIIEMLRSAHTRLPGAAARLAVADACVDTVTMVWLPHLVPNPEPMIAEAVRVLRPSGHLVTNRGQNFGARRGQGQPERCPRRRHKAGRQARAHHTGETSFVGVGQRGEPAYTLASFACT
jgi:SAM-dependent methyltransferase